MPEAASLPILTHPLVRFVTKRGPGRRGKRPAGAREEGRGFALFGVFTPPRRSPGIPNRQDRFAILLFAPRAKGVLHAALGCVTSMGVGLTGRSAVAYCASAAIGSNGSGTLNARWEHCWRRGDWGGRRWAFTGRPAGSCGSMEKALSGAAQTSVSAQGLLVESYHGGRESDKMRSGRHSSVGSAIGGLAHLG